jgi:predicted dehydrogenase
MLTAHALANRSTWELLMTTNPPLRIGVIGVGFGATVHVPGLLSEGWEEPVVLAHRIEVAREKAAALGVAEVAEDWHDLVERHHHLVVRCRRCRHRTTRW